MKSLSALLVSGTVLALLVGGLVATPVQANTAAALGADAPPAGLRAPEIITIQDAAVAAPEVDSAAPEGLAANEEAASPEISVEKDDAETTTADAADYEDLDALTAIAAEEARVELEAARKAEYYDNFLASVTNGNAGQPTGIYVDGGFAFSIGSQNGNGGYVTTNGGEVTRFGMAASKGSLGLLAHNHLAGASFFMLSPGATIHVVYGDGSIKDFVVSRIRNFQALQPDSPYSNFIDLDNGSQMSSTKVFNTIYNSNHPLVLQTCIARDGNPSWGRMFVIAVPA